MFRKNSIEINGIISSVYYYNLHIPFRCLLEKELIFCDNFNIDFCKTFNIGVETAVKLIIKNKNLYIMELSGMFLSKNLILMDWYSGHIFCCNIEYKKRFIITIKNGVVSKIVYIKNDSVLNNIDGEIFMKVYYPIMLSGAPYMLGDFFKLEMEQHKNQMNCDYEEIATKVVNNFIKNCMY